MNFSSLEEPFHRGGPSTDSQNLEMCDSETNKILRVIVEDMHYPVTIDVLHQVNANVPPMYIYVIYVIASLHIPSF